MKARTIAILALAIAVTSCNSILGVFRSASLAVTGPGGASTIEWPPGQQQTLINSMSDPSGLAGLEVEVRIGGDTMKFTAADLPSDRFDVPESGTVSVELRLRQDDVVVAEGTASWHLEADVEWRAAVDRTPYPISALVDDDFATSPNPVPCYWWWCHDTWRFDIAEDAVNYTGESLWLTVWRVHPGECADVC